MYNCLKLIKHFKVKVTLVSMCCLIYASSPILPWLANVHKSYTLTLPSPPPLESGVSSTVLHQLFSQHHLNSLLHNSSSVDISSIKGPSKFLCIFMNDKRFYLMSTFKAQWSGSWRGPLRECWGGSVTVITVVYSSVFFCQLIESL